MSTQTTGGPSRFTLCSCSAALSTTKPRQPWRRRASRQVFKKTTAEKKAAAEKCTKHWETYHQVLSQVTEVIQEQVMQMREQFGAHSVDYYASKIM